MTTENAAREEIEALRDWLEENRGNYAMASKILSDPDQVRGFVKSIVAKIQGAMRYNPYVDPPVAAVAEIAKLSERLGGVLSDVEFLDEYEDKKERYLSAVRAYTKEESEDTPPAAAE